MKTFEESLTAWIDDCLEGEEQAAFQRTLAARPDASELRGEKQDAARLRALLREHLPALTPALGQNADFFNHQLQERLHAEARGTEAALAAQPARPWWAALFGGSHTPGMPARLFAAGAACLLLAAAGIYTLLPMRGPASSANSLAVAAISPGPSSATPAPAQRRPESVADVASTSPVPSRSPAVVEADGSIRLARGDSSRRADPQLADIVAARVPEGTATSATAVHFDDQNADVLWLDGLEYQPDTPPSPPSGAAANGAENTLPPAPTPPPVEKQP